MILLILDVLNVQFLSPQLKTSVTQSRIDGLQLQQGMVPVTAEQIHSHKTQT